MRTKTLLLTAALGAAGIATSMAQVYSQNAVGYINLSLPAGFNLIANQLIPSGANPYSLNNLIPSPPVGTQVFKLKPAGGYDIYTFDEFTLDWQPSGTNTLDLGKGVWLRAASAFTLTFVGEVPQGTLTTPTPTGFSIVSSQVPQSGSVTNLGLTDNPGDQIFKFNGPGANPAYSIFQYDEFALAWTPSVPNLNVGEAFWLLRAPGPITSWVRTFSVN